MFSTQSTLDSTLTNSIYVTYRNYTNNILDKYYLCHLQSNDTNNILTNIYFTYIKIPTRALHEHSPNWYT